MKASPRLSPPTPRGSPSSATIRCCSSQRGPGQGRARQQGQFDRLPAGAGEDRRLRHQLEHRRLSDRLVGEAGLSGRRGRRRRRQAGGGDLLRFARRQRRSGRGLGRRTTRRSSRRTEWLNAQEISRPALFRAGHGSHHRARRRPRMAGRRRDGEERRSPAIPNIPTEEVFTTPHARRVEGHVVEHQAALLSGHADRRHRGPLRGGTHRRGEGLARRGRAEEGARHRRGRAPPRRGRAGAALLADLEERAPVLQHAVRRERRLPHRAWPVLCEMLRRRREAQPRARSRRGAATRA